MRKIILTLWVLLLFSIPSRVSADAAPPSQPPGYNPEPGTEITQVRMVSETVTIDILQDAPASSMGQAKVTAEFNMRNLGSQDELLAVRFPMGANNGYGTWVNINDFVVKIEGKTVNTRVVNSSGDDANFGLTDEIPWVVFDVAFPVNQDVSMQITYTLEAWGEMPFIRFDYIFATGAGWKDSIGSAMLIVNFPYEINNLNVLSDQYENEINTHQTQQNQLTWNYIDFEPQVKDNFSINLVSPSVWNTILKERTMVTVNPNDGEAWGRLGKLYKQITFSSRGRGFRSWSYLEDEGAQVLFNLSQEAYQKSVDIKPDDPLWHAGYADLMGYFAFWAGYEQIDTRPQAYNALQEIKLALDLAPEDPKVLEIADNLSFELENGLIKIDDTYQFPGLTSTPNLPTVEQNKITDTPVPQIATTSVNTPQKETSQVETPTIQTISSEEANKKGLPICGSLLFAPLGMLLWISRRKN